MPLPSGLILCEAFTTLREAAKRAARPVNPLGYLMPDVWKTRTTVAALRLSLLIIHSSADSLFPASMAEELYVAAQQGSVSAELLVFSGYRHDAVYRTVPDDYWIAILDFIARTSRSSSSRGDVVL